jgi:hypothetical protein
VAKNVIAATPYALVQHEREDFKHPKGGEAKYLTKTLAEKAEIYAERVAEGVRRALETASNS